MGCSPEASKTSFGVNRINVLLGHPNVFTFQQSRCWFEVTSKNFEVVLLFHYSIHLECTSATGSKWPSMDQTCLHITFHRCSLGFRSGEFGCQVNFSKSLLCSFLWSSCAHCWDGSARATRTLVCAM